MLLVLAIPRMGDLMTEGTIARVFVEPGARFEPGDPLFEMRVDLSAVAAQNCDPVSYARIVAHEAGWLRRLDGEAGAVLGVGATLAMASTSPDEPLDASAQRPLRVNVGVVPTLGRRGA